MAMQPREKKLAAAVGVLGFVLAAWYVAGTVGSAFDIRQKQLEAAEREARQKNFQLVRGVLAKDRLEDWQRRSLPRDRELARSLYQNWLTAALDAAGLTEVQVEPGRATIVRDNYSKLPFTLRAQGSLEQVSRWLAAFYRTDYLHQVRDLGLQPLGAGGKLQLTVTIEALSLYDADLRDKLPPPGAGRLDEAAAAQMVKAITARNWFAEYVPPPPPKPAAVVRTAPPPPPPKPVFDDAKYTVLTSITFIDDKPQAWLSVRPKQKTLKLSEGDGIEVGQFHGKLIRIGAREIEVEQDGKRRVVALGKPLTDGATTNPGT